MAFIHWPAHIRGRGWYAGSGRCSSDLPTAESPLLSGKKRQRGMWGGQWSSNAPAGLLNWLCWCICTLPTSLLSLCYLGLTPFLLVSQQVSCQGIRWALRPTTHSAAVLINPFQTSAMYTVTRGMAAECGGVTVCVCDKWNYRHGWLHLPSLSNENPDIDWLIDW